MGVILSVPDLHACKRAVGPSVISARAPHANPITLPTSHPSATSHLRSDLRRRHSLTNAHLGVVHLHGLEQDPLIPSEIQVDLVRARLCLFSVSTRRRICQSSQRVSRELGRLSCADFDIAGSGESGSLITTS